MNENIGEQILAKRKERGLTQGEVAARCGVSVQAVSKWERGLAKPSEAILVQLVDFLGLAVEYPAEKQKEEKVSWFNRFITDVFRELPRIISVAVIIAGIICFSLRFISAETAFYLCTLSSVAFLLITILKQG